MAIPIQICIRSYMTTNSTIFLTIGSGFVCWTSEAIRGMGILQRIPDVGLPTCFPGFGAKLTTARRLWPRTIRTHMPSNNHVHSEYPGYKLSVENEKNIM